MIPLVGFVPDADATEPGVLTDCANLIPYATGMEGAPSSLTPASTPALATACLGAAVLTDLTGARRVFAGAATKLWELSAGAWVDRSGAAYGGGTDTRWSFAQFGNSALASNRADAIQRSTAGAFAAIATAPKAEIIYSVGPQVMALNTNDGAEKPDGWHCCAIYDETSWTPSVTTQAASGRLVGTAGAITAGARLGEYAIAYKAKSIYVGRYVGAPSVWDWIQVPGGEVGCVGKEAVCDIGGAHLFVGDDNIYLFDGTRPVAIADGVLRQWFVTNSNPSYRYRIKCAFDRQTNRVWIHYPSLNSTSCDEALVYHVPTKRWGRVTRSIQALLNYIAPGITYDTWSTAGATYDTLLDIAYDSQYWSAGGQALSVFDTSNQIQLLSGNSTSSSLTTGDTGDDERVTLLSQIRIRYAPGYAPTTATVQTLYKMSSGEAYAVAATGAINDGKFDTLKAARWHRATISFTGPVRVMALDARYKEQGLR